MNQLILLIAAAFMVICGIYAVQQGLVMLAKIVKDMRSDCFAPTWKPIESAPKDGTDVLVWLDGNRTEQYNGRSMVCRYDDYSGWSIPGIGGLNATHWRPTPEAPR